MSIIGIGAAAPKVRVSNDDLATFVDTDDEWITQRVGIKTRFVAGREESSESMAIAAIKETLHDFTGRLDFLIVATETPSQLLPSAAARIQNELDLGYPYMAFDVKAACSGFLFALEIANGLLRTNAKYGVVVGVETISRYLDYQDRATSVVFGDGGGAFLLDAEPFVVASSLYTDGKMADLINRTRAPFPASTFPEGLVGIESVSPSGDPYLRMNGKEVFKNVIPRMMQSIDEVLELGTKNLELAEPLTVRDISKFVPHQANLRILNHIAKEMGFVEDQVVINIDKYGNTSAGSIPLACYEGDLFGESCLSPRSELKEKLGGKKLVLLTAAGAGLTWGSMLITV